MGASGDSPATVRERVLLVAVGDHLERSQMVLVELVNAHAHGELDISSERQWADELLASNRLYRQTAVQLGQTNVADVLDDLERVLVEVARGPSEISMAQLTEIQQRIEAQGILFKVKIIGSEARERGNLKPRLLRSSRFLRTPCTHDFSSSSCAALACRGRGPRVGAVGSGAPPSIELRRPAGTDGRDELAHGGCRQETGRGDSC